MPITNTALADKIDTLVSSWQDVVDAFQAWSAGTANGGPNSDGEYPLLDYLGATQLVKSPAKLEDLVDAVVASAQAYADAASASATASAASAVDAASSATDSAASAAAALASESSAFTYKTAAEAAMAVAIAQAGAASTSAAAAAASATASATSATASASSATAAAASAVTAGLDVTYAAEWANKAHNSLVSTAAGGDHVDDYSALHWATEAATFNPALYALLAGATFTGAVIAPTFSGNGASLTALTAANITAGGTLPALNGAALTALNASNLASGTVPDARFPATLPAASGVNLTALNATNIASGTLADARLTSNIPLKNAANTFTANQTMTLADARLHINSPSGSAATIAFDNNGTAKSYMGISIGTSSIITGDVANDTVFRSEGGNMLFSTDSGASWKLKLDSSGNLTVKNTIGTYSATGGPILLLNNTHSTGESPLDFQINGTLRGRIRADYTGNVAYVANGGAHYFFTGGDSGVGTNIAFLAAAGYLTMGNVDLVPNGTAVTYTYGNLIVSGTTAPGGFRGVSVYDASTLTPTLMTNGSVAGIFAQAITKWIIYGDNTNTIYTSMAQFINGNGGAFLGHGSSSYPSGTITVSSSAPSGGSNGDVWFKV